MKKFLLCLLVASAALQSTAQNWQASNLTNVIYLAITATESHNNELYATVFNGSTASFNKLNANGTSWSTINLPNVTVPRFIQSAGTRMYISTLNSGIISELFYTYDEGAHLVMDTAGLPRGFGSVSTIFGLQYFAGKVIANMGGGGYYLKDTTATKWVAINVPTALNGGADPITCNHDTLFAYDNTGTHTLYYSTNWGTNWTVQTTDLPNEFACGRIVPDLVTGRLYCSGIWDNNLKTGVFYSENSGKNWTQLNLAAFITKSANNGAQNIQSLYANGNNIYIGLENNKDQTAPDLISTKTGVNGFAYDTLGLPKSAAGVYPVKIQAHKNKVFTALNVIDVFLKGDNSGITTNTLQNLINVFPNPASDLIQLDANGLKLTSVNILDVSGKLIYAAPFSSTLDVSGLPAGNYTIQCFSSEGLVAVQSFVKQ